MNVLKKNDTGNRCELADSIAICKLIDLDKQLTFHLEFFHVSPLHKNNDQVKEKAILAMFRSSNMENILYLDIREKVV